MNNTQAYHSPSGSGLLSPVAVVAKKRPKGRWFITLVLTSFLGMIFTTVWQEFGRFVAFGLISGEIISVSTTQQGCLADLLVDEGDWVSAGEPVAMLDSDSLLDQQKRVEQQLEIASSLLQVRLAELLIRREELVLCADPNRESARELHAELLQYRGVSWNLDYCVDFKAARAKLNNGTYQSLLFRTGLSPDAASFQISEMLRHSNCPPVVTLSDHFSDADQVRLIVEGSEDCVNRSETNGTSIMRGLRLAASAVHLIFNTPIWFTTLPVPTLISRNDLICRKAERAAQYAFAKD